MRVLALTLAVVVVTIAVPATAADPPDWSQAVSCAEAQPSTGVLHRRFVDGPFIVAVDALCDTVGAATTLPTDCTRTTYGLTGWRWSAAWSARLDPRNPYGLASGDLLAAFSASAQTWDDETSADIHGATTLGGKARDAGRYDQANQIGFKRLASGTIAVTTTWYYRSTGLAVESDQAYSTRYAWSLGGSASSFGVREIATHETGHTFGLVDLYDAADACLTMYGYGSYGATHAQTLGDGDIVGLRALYGS